MDKELKQKKHDLIKEIYDYNNVIVERSEEDTTVTFDVKYNNKIESFQIFFTTKKEMKRHKKEDESSIYHLGFFAEKILEMNLLKEHIDKVIKLFYVTEEGLKVLKEKSIIYDNINLLDEL